MMCSIHESHDLYGQVLINAPFTGGSSHTGVLGVPLDAYYLTPPGEALNETWCVARFLCRFLLVGFCASVSTCRCLLVAVGVSLARVARVPAPLPQGGCVGATRILCAQFLCGGCNCMEAVPMPLLTVQNPAYSNRGTTALPASLPTPFPRPPSSRHHTSHHLCASHPLGRSHFSAFVPQVSQRHQRTRDRHSQPLPRGPGCGRASLEPEHSVDPAPGSV